MSAHRLFAIDYALGLLSDDARRSMDGLRKQDQKLDAAIIEAEAMLDESPVRSGCALQSPDKLFGQIVNNIIATGCGQPWYQARPGISIRPLWNDSSFLLQCVEGTPFPAHWHEREERTVVLYGKFTIGTRSFGPGACQIAARHTHHDEGLTRQDCLILIQYGD